MKEKTKILHAAAAKDTVTGALSIPVYHASTYHQPDIDGTPEWDYGRSGNPTRQAVEDLLAALECGCSGFAFGSGMAAISAAITAFVKAGDHIVATRDIYGGSYRLLTGYLPRFGVTTSFIDMTDVEEVERSIQPNTTMLFLESPSNPLLKVTDIKAVAAFASARGILTVVDNTFMTPYLQRPIDMGIDISVHSATKFLGGHSDLIAGAVITSSAHHAAALKFVQNTCGGVLSPNDSWLLIRGIKTLSARMDAQCKTADALARWLKKQPWVSEVFYPGLESHPGHSTIASQATGFGAVVSVKTGSVEVTRGIMRNVKLWNVAVSLGGVESILSYPWKMSHASIPPAERERLGISEDLVRLSVGLEDGEDLMEDLETAVHRTS